MCSSGREEAEADLSINDEASLTAAYGRVCCADTNLGELRTQNRALPWPGGVRAIL